MSTKATFDVLKWIVGKGHTDLCPKYWGDHGECECGLDNAHDAVAELLKKGQQPMTTERSGMSLESDDEACCDVCHETIADGCACQNEYAREHDSGSER